MASITATFLFTTLYWFILSEAVEVNTIYGDVKGIITNGIQQFKKIPYARPPIESLRFASPEEPDSWLTTLDAGEQLVPACPQVCILGGGPFGPCALSAEDCLYLNIYAPADADSDSEYPVLIWLHGGAFDQGWTDFVGNDPTNIVLNNDVIVVTFNYRLGLLGFLFDNTYSTDVVGNYGLEDQLLAIKFVYENIENFGGDKDKIVLMGESAGASSVLTHLLYNDQYFEAAIALSPGIVAPFRSPTTWFDVPVQFTDLINCTDFVANPVALLDCWRSVPSDTILNIQATYATTLLSNGWPWAPQIFSPTIETSLVETQPLFAFQNSDVETKPFLIGSDDDEFFLFIDPELVPLFGYEQLIGQLATLMGSLEISQQIINFYGITAQASITDNYLYDYGRILSDNWYCSIRNLVENIEDPEDTYYYNLETIDPALAMLANFREPCWSRTCHGIENQYVFLAPAFMAGYTQDQLDIGNEFQRLLTNYAEERDPNGDGTEIWPEYENENDDNNFLRISGVNQFDAKSTFTEPDVHFCWFWDQVGYSGTYQLATNLVPPSNGDDDDSSDSDSSDSNLVPPSNGDDDDDSSDSSSESVENALNDRFNEDNEELNNEGYTYDITIDLSGKSLINVWTLLIVVVLFIVLTTFWFYECHANTVQFKKSAAHTAEALYL